MRALPAALQSVAVVCDRSNHIRNAIGDKCEGRGCVRRASRVGDIRLGVAAGEQPRAGATCANAGSNFRQTQRRRGQDQNGSRHHRGEGSRAADHAQEPGGEALADDS